MTKLLLGDAFNNISKLMFGISEQDILETYDKPDYVQELKIEVKIYVKKHKNEKHKSVLLLCTQESGGCNFFVFSYWIPEEIANSSTEPLLMLKQFAATFGSRIKVGYTEDTFILEATVALDSKLNHPDQAIQILGSEHIPCQYYLFYDSEFVVSSTLVFLDVYYAFSIDNNKYTKWLYQISEARIKVPKQCVDWLSGLIGVLEPSGKTQLRILKSACTSSAGESSVVKDLAEVSVPESYKHQFYHISNLLTSSELNAKVIVIPIFSSPKCLFCDSTDVSKEHIFPQWLKPFFDEAIFSSTLCLKTNSEEDLLAVLHSGVEERKESFYGYTTKAVCKHCNNTWMSELESKAKSVLTDDGEKLKESLADINEHDAKILSKWLLKIAILLPLKSVHYPILPLDIYTSLKEDNVPIGTVVEVAYSQNHKLDYVYSHGADFVTIRAKNMPLSEAIELADAFFVASIQVGKFLFRVSYLSSYSPLSREVCLKETDILFPWKGDLPFCNIDTGEQIWMKAVSGAIELPMFNYGINLVA